MRLVFVSNHINPHQKPLADEFYSLLGDEYQFVQMTPLPDERKKMGWQLDEQAIPYLHTFYLPEEKEKCKRSIQNADVVVVGAVDFAVVSDRLKARKMTYIYSERLYKKGIFWWKWLWDFVNSYRYYGRYQKYKPYLLCAGAYVAYDMNRFRNFSNRMYKWGYFPQFIEYKENWIRSQKENSTIEILWAGRMIEWKHPEMVIDAAKKLKEEGYQFHITIVGDGNARDKIVQSAKNYKLEDCVSFTGVKEPNDVRKYMIKANIFLATSDYQEGWGAVLNEAMNSACAVIASHAMGAAPWLIDHEKDGLIFHSGNMEEMIYYLKKLLEDDCYRETLGLNAYQKIKEQWTPRIAAKNFLALIEQNTEGILKGPCCKAEIVDSRWVKGR